jgi:hypothetical protein
MLGHVQQVSPVKYLVKSRNNVRACTAGKYSIIWLNQGKMLGNVEQVRPEKYLVKSRNNVRACTAGEYSKISG